MTDNDEIFRIGERLKSATKRLQDMAPSLGTAKQIREFASDRRKQILAVETVKAMKTEKSIAAAETVARASEAYAVALDEQARQLEESEKVCARWTAEEASFEAARSLLSWQKEISKICY